MEIKSETTYEYTHFITTLSNNELLIIKNEQVGTVRQHGHLQQSMKARKKHSRLSCCFKAGRLNREIKQDQ